MVSDRSFRYGDPEAAFAQPGVRTVRTTVRYPRNSCSPIECGVVLAEHLAGEEGYDVLSNFMGPFSLHAVMAMALKVPGNKLRHRVPRDSGGSFGVKQAVFQYVVLMCLAARKAGAPVKWVEDRLEHLSAATSATSRLTTLEAAVDAQGRVLALRYDQVDEVGGYLRAPEPATFYRMHGALTGAYDIAHVAARNRVVVTNKTPSGLVRGFGGPQVYYALERLMDRIAVEPASDPVQLRLANYVRADQFPYTAAAGAVLRLRRLRTPDATGHGGGAGAWTARAPAPGAGRRTAVRHRRGGHRRTVGVEHGLHQHRAHARAARQGGAEERGDRQRHGGHRPAGRRQRDDRLRARGAGAHDRVRAGGRRRARAAAVPGGRERRIRHRQGRLVGRRRQLQQPLRRRGRRHGAPRGAPLAGQARAHRRRPVRLRRRPTSRFEGGQVFNRQQPARTQAFTRLAASPHWAPALLPPGESPGLRETAFWTGETLAAPDPQDRVNTSAAYGFVFDVCGLEVDRDTGAVRVDRYVTAHDAGRLLNPALADGQVRGAFAQGLGAALLEEFTYGADGSFQAGTLADYLMPTTCETPDPVIVHLETPSPFTPLGAKGLGEGNNMSTPVCIANAFADALRPLRDLADVRLPLTPSRVLACLDTADPPPSRPWREPKPAAAAADGLSLAAQGTVEIAAAPERVFAVLLDPVALARVIPGCHALQPEGENRYRADVSVGVGLIRARYEARVELSELDPPHRLRLAGRGVSPLGTAAGDGVVRLEASATGTRLHYDYRAQVGGKVAMVGSRMLEGAARVIVAQLFESLGRQAAGGTPAPPGPMVAPPVARAGRTA